VSTGDDDGDDGDDGEEEGEGYLSSSCRAREEKRVRSEGEVEARRAGLADEEEEEERSWANRCPVTKICACGRL